MAIDTMGERLKNGEATVDIFGYVSLLRNQRNFMVQTEVSLICFQSLCYHSSLARTSTSSSMKL